MHSLYHSFLAHLNNVLGFCIVARKKPTLSPYTMGNGDDGSASKTSGSLGSDVWKRQLELAIAWNRADIAETHIFSEESQWKVGLSRVHARTPTAICFRCRVDK